MDKLALLLLVAVAGCRTQPLDQPIGGDDFGAISIHDMAARVRIDMSVPNGTGCTDLLGCLNGCQTQSCQDQCFMDATQDAQNLLSETLNCIYGFCQARDGNRAPRCDINFMDLPDAGDGSCNDCLTNAYASLGGYPCTPSDSPDCSPPKCQMLVDACLQQ